MDNLVNIEPDEVLVSSKNDNNTVDTTKLVDKDIFFSASVAYKKTQLAQKKKIEASMLPIYSKINEAINNGEYGIALWLTKEEKDFLFAKNFRMSSVKIDGAKTYYKIFWS